MSDLQRNLQPAQPAAANPAAFRIESLSSRPASAAHNLALSSLPNFSLPGDVSASKRYWAEDIIAPEVTVSAAGEITVPTAPGRGFDIDRDRIEHLTVRRHTLH